ncbi:MAG TPA: DUF4340 domain-containing protein [Candidatus Binatia bacterium]|nr:DUF4340 domain-containing protein [Candidatus Binatia bacterium]
MKRAAIAHGLFLLATLALAAHVWRDRATPRGELPVLLDAQVDELTTATYRWPEGETRVLREGEGKGRAYAVSVTHTFYPERDRRRAAALADPKNRIAIKLGKSPDEIAEAAAAAGPPGEAATETKIFPPGLFSIANIQKLTPFRARRSLGDVPGDQLPGMGLDKPLRSLSIVARSRELRLEIGGKTFGGQAVYARVPGQGEVFLVDADVIATLETTPRAMMDSRLVAVPLSDVLGLELEFGGKRAEFIQRNKDQFRARFFTRRGAPEKKSEAVDGLMSTFVGLKAADFLDVAPPQGQPLCLIRFLREDAPPHEVRIFALPAGGYRITSGRWIADLPEADARKILEEVRVAVESG